MNSRSSLLDARVVVPGNSGDSYLIELISSSDPDASMPPPEKPRVSPAEIQILKEWIDAGMPWEEGFTFAESRYEPPLYPRQPAIPDPVEGREHPIDRIIDSYLERNGLPRPEPLDDSAFLRRVYLDVIGLLPSREEYESFMADTGLDRRKRLIHRLLGRDRDYAVHWLTFWNDLLRNTYSGTGFIDDGRRQITRWLYQSLLENKLFDEFVRELIAPTPASEGFIRGIKWRGKVSASQRRSVQFAQSLSQVFLGINMKCASCHDSFIDRWTLDEAYGLAAVYASEPLELFRCDQPTGRMATPAWIFPQLGQIDPTAEQPKRLRQLAGLVTHPEDGRFTRTIANRIWHQMMGRGIVHPVDAMHTPPWDRDLLDYLGVYLAEHRYDVKALIAHIATSSAYQSQTAISRAPVSPEKYRFHGPVAKRMTAEQFLDGIRSLTGVWPDPDPHAFKMDGRKQGGQLQAVLRAEEAAGFHPSLRDKWCPEAAQTAAHSARWIWAPGSVTNQTVFFRRRFESPSTASVVAIAASPHPFKTYLNGRPMAEYEGGKTPVVIELTHRLQAGGNVFAVEVEGHSSSEAPPGFIGTLAGQDGQGRTAWRLSTDPDWKISLSAHSGWTDPAYVDSDWAQATGWQPDPEWQSPDQMPEWEEPIYVEDWSGRWGDRIIRTALTPRDALQASLGRPNREQIVTSRPALLTTMEAIDLANGPQLSGLLEQGAQYLARQSWSSRDKLIDWLYLGALARMPSGDERAVATNMLGSNPQPEGIADLLWAVTMLPEFHYVN